jgi:Tol biopolymer transport system component
LASMRSLFKLTLLAGLAIVCLGPALGLTPNGLSGQAPDEAWRTIKTEHFRVTFPERLEMLGRKAADRSEWAWLALSEHFIDPPDGIIDVLVTDHADVSNGFAQLRPSNRITVYARPPTDLLSLGHVDEWLELVITHELTHIVHLDLVRNAIGRSVRAVFGRIQGDWPFFPELGTPRWVIEGLATWYESRLTQAGRVRGTYEEMQIRTAIIENRFENIGQASGDGPLWPGGNRAYAYGSLFFEFLLTRHGEDGLAAFVEAIAGQWIPYRIDAAGRDAFGDSLSDEWRAWRSELETELSDLDAQLALLAPVSDPEQMTEGARLALYPKVSPDGAWLAYSRSDGRSDTQLRLRDRNTGESRALGRTNGSSTFDWLPDGRLLVAQLEFQDAYRIYGDLYLFDDEGRQDRLTEGARLSQPSVAPDGRYAVAIRQGGGTNSIVRVDLASGGVTDLVPADSKVHWAFPSISPDGRWIAATKWRPNAYHDVVILRADNGELVHEVTADRALDLAPSWGPDSGSIVWTSDRTGIVNILGAEVDSETGVASEARLLTNVRTGAAYPSIDPSGDWLYFSGYHVDGWEVERIPLLEANQGLAPPAVSRFALDGVPPKRGTHDGVVETYSSGPTILPRYWEVAYRDPVVTPSVESGGQTLRRRELLGFGLGVRTGGRDLVGRHSYGAVGRVFTSGGKAEGSASYAYRGLGNPVLTLAASQRYSDGGQQLVAATSDTLFVLERERSVEAAVSFNLPRWRRNLSFAVGGGLVWEDRALLDKALQPSRSYSLAMPTGRMTDLSAAVKLTTARSHAFQMGRTRGASLSISARARNELSLADTLVNVAGFDRSTREVVVRFRGALPLWGGGYTSHVLAVQASAGVAQGPGANAFHFRVGGASGQLENLTGMELFGGSFIPHALRGYDTSSRFGRYAWSASTEYRFPLGIIDWGMGAWPLYLNRAMGSVFFDSGNAWAGSSLSGAANPRGKVLASVGAEITTEILGLYDVGMRLRMGLAMPLVDGDGVRAYLRVGLPF